MRAVPSAASQDLVRPNGLPPMTSFFIDPKTLKSWLHDGGEIALLDVREHGQYGEAHLFYGIPLPFSRCLLYTSPSPRDGLLSRMPSSA